MDDESRSVLISLRLHKDLLHQIDLVQDWVADDAVLTPSGSTNRSEVIRHLIVMGLQSLDLVKGDQVAKDRR